LGDADGQALQGVGAVVFERELALDGVDDRLDPLADLAERAVAVGFVFAVGAQQPAAEAGDELFEVGPGRSPCRR
jgi:hypothetical protein